MADILLVEDDKTLAAGLTYALEKEGYLVTYSGTVADAREKAAARRYDLALLDLQLPDGTGREVGALLKQKITPVIYLTVVDDEEEIVRSLEDGAADYVTKPFRMRELLARIKRSLHGESGNGGQLAIGKAVIDEEAGKVYVEDCEIVLTALEYRLLLIFAKNQSILLKREQILERIWDISGNFVEDNTLTVYVKRLREKLGDAVSITTVRGIGYRVDQ
ncbi:MAG: response regulator transcription factor [Bacteroidales bacterium]|nr:response regulator transcription factor [Bacteroidales bacterium]MCM1416115.1 response regulator transcription factor [bacterium]MCM1422847.1 response regulator transcription factor [bacterium]